MAGGRRRPVHCSSSPSARWLLFVVKGFSNIGSRRMRKPVIKRVINLAAECPVLGARYSLPPFATRVGLGGTLSTTSGTRAPCSLSRSTDELHRHCVHRRPCGVWMPRSLRASTRPVRVEMPLDRRPLMIGYPLGIRVMMRWNSRMDGSFELPICALQLPASEGEATNTVTVCPSAS